MGVMSYNDLQFLIIIWIPLTLLIQLITVLATMKGAGIVFHLT